jgi:DNA-directed RNA polymerase subunit M
LFESFIAEVRNSLENSTGSFVMEFCPKCGSRLVPKKSEMLVSMVCPKCGYVKQESDSKTDTKGSSKVIKHSLQQQVTVIGKEDEVNTMPTMRMECPKCGNMIVYVWQVQTRGGDEASTQFFRCTKCNHTFREYT